jgi:hypothetical protein
MAPVFKTGEWHLAMSLVGSTPIRFRHLFSAVYEGFGWIAKMRDPEKPVSRDRNVIILATDTVTRV